MSQRSAEITVTELEVVQRFLRTKTALQSREDRGGIRLMCPDSKSLIFCPNVPRDKDSFI